MTQGIQLMSMNFDYYKQVDIRDSRKLLLDALSKYLSAINGNQEIRPYLHDFPFTAKNVEIHIWIHESTGCSPAVDKIHYVSAVNGVLSYYSHFPGSHQRKTLCKETYKEAIKKIIYKISSDPKIDREEFM